MDVSVQSAASAAVVGAASSSGLWTLEGWRNADPVMGMALLMIVALVASEAVSRWLKLPRTIGPILVGVLASPIALRLLDRMELDAWKPLLDLAIGVLLFELGARLHPRWLLANPWLAVKCVAEAVVTFAAVTSVLVVLGAPLLSAAVAGAVAMATSPIITMSVMHEMESRGQVAERLLLMSAINSVLAVLVLKAWGILAATLGDPHPGVDALAVLTNALVVVLGSFLLGIIGGMGVEVLSRVVTAGRQQAVLHMAIVVLVAMLANQWKLSSLLTLLVTGLVARWRMGHRLRVDPQLGSAGAALSTLLLISLGVLATVTDFWRLWPWILAIIATRFLAKGLVVLALARPSALGWRQALGLTLALQPMSSIAVLLTAETFAWPPSLPQPDATILQALLVATSLMQTLGPLWIRAGLGRLSGESNAVIERR